MPPPASARAVSSGGARAQALHFFLESKLLELHAGEGVSIGAGALVFRCYAGIQIGVTGFQALDAGLQVHGASLREHSLLSPSEPIVEWQRKRNAIAAENAMPNFSRSNDASSGRVLPC